MPDEATRAVEADDVRLVDLATILLRRWRLVLGTAFAALLLTMLVAVLLPGRYTARTVLVPAQEKGGSPSAQLLARLPEGVPALGSLGRSDPKQQLIEAILRSTTLEDRVVERVAGAEPGAPSEGLVRRILERHTKVAGDLSDGAITIEVSAARADLAARIANAFPSTVNEIATDIGVQLTDQRQKFLESQLETAAKRLSDSEQRILSFQQERDLPAAEAQAEKTLELAANMQQAIITKELEVARLRRTSTPDNPELRGAEAELASLRQQLQRLASGGGTREQLLVPIRESPELKVEATRLLRDYSKNEQIFLSLTAALADAQIEAHNSLPVVAVLDPAAPPSVPAPKYVPLLASLAALLGLLLGCIAAFTSEYLRRLRTDPANQSLFAAWEQVKSDVTPRRRRGPVREPARE